MVINSPICQITKGKVSDSSVSQLPHGISMRGSLNDCRNIQNIIMCFHFVQLANKCCPFLMCMLFIFLISTFMTKSNYSFYNI